MLPYYANRHTHIFNCDCLEWMRSQQSAGLDLTVTSPPYDNIRDYQGYSFDFPAVAKELFRLTRSGGVVVWNVSDATVGGSETGTSMRQALYMMSCGFRLHDTMIYLKKNPMPTPVSHRRYHQSWEYLFIFSKDVPKTFNPKMVPAKFGHLEARMKHRGRDGVVNYKKTKRNEYTKVRNVFEYAVGGGHSARDRIAYQHPAIMPESLAADMITTWSNVGDMVFDPFMGSGTTIKMAGILNRCAVGCEISEPYCAVAQQRLQNMVSD